MKYDKSFLRSTLYMLKAQISDLETWSINNDDEYNEEITKIRELVHILTKSAGGQ